MKNGIDFFSTSWRHQPVTGHNCPWLRQNSSWNVLAKNTNFATQRKTPPDFKNTSCLIQTPSYIVKTDCTTIGFCPNFGETGSVIGWCPKKKTFRHVVDVRECDTVGTIPVYSVSSARHTKFLYGGFSNWFQSFGQNYCGFWLAWLCRELNLVQKYASQGFQFFFHGSRRVSHFIWIKTRKVKTYACVPTRKP